MGVVVLVVVVVVVVVLTVLNAVRKIVGSAVLVRLRGATGGSSAAALGGNASLGGPIFGVVAPVLLWSSTDTGGDDDEFGCGCGLVWLSSPSSLTTDLSSECNCPAVRFAASTVRRVLVPAGNSGRLNKVRGATVSAGPVDEVVELAAENEAVGRDGRTTREAAAATAPEEDSKPPVPPLVGRGSHTRISTISPTCNDEDDDNAVVLLLLLLLIMMIVWSDTEAVTDPALGAGERSSDDADGGTTLVLLLVTLRVLLLVAVVVV